MSVSVPLYEFMNMFLTGTVFVVGMAFCNPGGIDEAVSSCIASNLRDYPDALAVIGICTIIYAIGLILNRIGAIPVEWILRKTKLIDYKDDYALYLEKQKEYSHLNVLSREYSLSRTLLAESIIIAFVALICNKFSVMAIFIVLGVLFYFSCKKNAKLIVYALSSNAKE